MLIRLYNDILSKNKRATFILLFLLMVVIPTTEVFAEYGSWVQNSTYYDEGDTLINNSAPGDNGVPEWDDRKTANADWLDRTIGYIPAGIAYNLHKTLSKYHMGLDDVILGRVKNGASWRNDYSFELVAGNVYGYVGATGYAIFRAVILIYWLFAFLLELARQGISTSAKTKSEFKDYLSTLGPDEPLWCFALRSTTVVQPVHARDKNQLNKTTQKIGVNR